MVTGTASPATITVKKPEIPHPTRSYLPLHLNLTPTQSTPSIFSNPALLTQSFRERNSICIKRERMRGEDLENRGRGEGEGDGGGTGEVKSRPNNRTYPVSSDIYTRDDSETQWTPWLIPMFVVANVAMFLTVMFVNNCPKNNLGLQGKCVARFLGRFSFEPIKGNPLFGPSSATLEKLGALEWSKVVQKHQGWRLATCVWLHAGVIHLVANMLSLVFIGIRLEQQFGFVRIGIVYLLSGFGGSILSSLFIRNISVGASGGLFGLLGAVLSELITNWTIYTNKAAALITLLVIVVINLGLGILPHVDNFAHIGGFLGGFFLGFVLLPRPQYGWSEHQNVPAGVRVKSKYKAYQYAFWLISLAMLIVGFTVALVMLFRGENGNDHCPWCRYVTCVPTSRWNCDEK